MFHCLIPCLVWPVEGPNVCVISASDFLKLKSKFLDYWNWQSLSTPEKLQVRSKALGPSDITSQGFRTRTDCFALQEACPSHWYLSPQSLFHTPWASVPVSLLTSRGGYLWRRELYGEEEVTGLISEDPSVCLLLVWPWRSLTRCHSPAWSPSTPAHHMLPAPNVKVFIWPWYHEQTKIENSKIPLYLQSFSPLISEVTKKTSL